MRVLLMGLLLFLAACSNTNKKSTGSQEKGDWPQEMRQAGESFQALLPYIYDADKFSAKRNRKDVERKIAKFSNHFGNSRSDGTLSG